MKTNTKSSITLPASELELVMNLMKTLKSKSKVDVIRKGLLLLKETTDRKTLRAAYKAASKATREKTIREMEDLDAVTDEGLS